MLNTSYREQANNMPRTKCLKRTEDQCYDLKAWGAGLWLKKDRESVG